MKYFYVLTAKTEIGEVGSVHGFVDCSNPVGVLTQAVLMFRHRENLKTGRDISQDELVILFFNFWESPEQGLGGK